MEAELLEKTLGKSALTVEHIGSTAVPGLSAKNTIDIICVVDNLDSSLKLKNIGYVFKGELNVPLRYYFSKNTAKSNINLHVCEKNHGFIALNLCFRDYLRAHEEEKIAYNRLKEILLKDPKSFEKKEGVFSGYNLGKNTFIKSILKKAQYTGLYCNFCMHENEWEAYHNIRKKLIFDPLNVEYDQHHPTLTDKNHSHIVLYKDCEIVGVAHVEILSESTCALRPFAIDTPHQGKGLGSFLLEFVEKWIKQKKIHKIHLHAREEKKNFYLKNGYKLMPFPDYKPGLPSISVDMGKNI